MPSEHLKVGVPLKVVSLKGIEDLILTKGPPTVFTEHWATRHCVFGSDSLNTSYKGNCFPPLLHFGVEHA